MSKLVQNIIPIGLNRDDDQRAMAPGDSPSMNNVIRQPGKGGVLSPIKGTVQVYEEDVAQTSQMIGSCEDRERGVKIFFFYETYQGTYAVLDSLSIREWDGTNMTPIVERVYGLYPQGTDVDDITLECDVSSGMLFWTDGVGEPRKLNIEMMKGYTTYKDVKYYGGTNITVNVGDEVYIDGVGVYRIDSLPFSNFTLSEPDPSFLRVYCTKLSGPIYWFVSSNRNQTYLIRVPPRGTVVDRVMDGGLSRTELVDVVYRFAYRYIYYDEERSVFSQPSEPLMNPYYGGNASAVQFNAVDITVDVGMGDIKGVEIAVHDMVGNTWYRAGELMRSDLRGVTGEHTYRFTASNVGGVIPQDEVDRSHDSVPISCDHIIAAEGRVLTVGVTEGMGMEFPPPVTVSIEQGEVKYAFEQTTFYNQNDWTDSGSNTKRFGHRRYTSNYLQDDVPPAGVTVEVFHGWVNISPYSQTAREWSTQITTDGTETMLAFTERVASVLNGRTHHMFQSPFDAGYKNHLNLWYTYYVDGNGYVRLIESLGLQRELDDFLVDTSISGINTFINNGPLFYGQIVIESQSDYFYDFAVHLFFCNRSYSWHVDYSTVSFGFDPGRAVPIFKGGSTYSIGPYYMDAQGRRTPCPSLAQFQMPDYQYKDYYRDVEVTINGLPPQDARYWGLCRSQGSMADVEQIHLMPQGLASIGSIKNNPYSENYQASFIMDLAIEGVTLEDTDSGKLYWGMDSYNRFVLTKNPGTVTSGVVARSVRTISLVRKILTKRPRWDLFKRDTLGMDVGALVKTEGDQEAQLRGVGTDITGHVKIGWPNYARPFINTDSYIEVDFDSYKTGSTGAWEYRLDVAPYVNTLKKNIEDESQILVPQEGDMVRVLEASGSNKTKANGLLTISRVEGAMVNDDEGNYFKHFFIHTHPSNNNLNFHTGGVIEIYRVRKGQAHLLFEEDRIFPIVWSSNRYVHGGGELLGNGGVKVKTHKGDTYLRERDFLGMDGSILKTTMVESPRASDHYPSKVWGIGRVNAEGRLERKYFPTVLRHGGRLLEGTMINNIPTFHANDITLLDTTYGRIVGAASIPNGVRLVFTRRAVTIDLGVMVVTRPDGQSELTATDRFIGSIRPSVNRWGCSHRASFVSTPRGLYYYDAHSGQMLSDGANGQHSISGRVTQGEHSHDYKMHTYFKDLTEGDTVVSGWDERHGMLFVRVNTGCVAFSRGDHRWMGPYSLAISGLSFVFTERFEHLGRDLFAVLGNRMYQLHHSGDNILDWPRSAHIDLIANEGPQMIKIFDAIRLRMEGVEWDNVPNDFIRITITENDTYREMYSVITKGMLKREEGQYVAQVLKNMKTTTDTAKNSDLHNGMEMRGYVARIRLNFGTSDFSFLSADVVMERST